MIAAQNERRSFFVEKEKHAEASASQRVSLIINQGIAADAMHGYYFISEVSDSSASSR